MNNPNDLKTKKTAKAEKILNQIKARQSVNQRTIETRKKIILGAMLQDWARTGQIDQATIDQGLDRYLVGRDRALFGLTEKSKT